jgi:hypothetical protein
MTMHDIDRTRLEAEWEVDGLDGEAEYEADYEAYEAEFEFESEWEYEAEGPFSEAEEMELAAELLEITDEYELDQFIGKLVRRGARAVGRAIKSPTGRALTRKLLPIAGRAVGNLIVPGAGGVVGARLAAGAGRAFGLELEGLTPEDQEFEVARRVVRLAGDAAQKAATAPSSVPPDAAASRAVASAARKHAPGLVPAGAAAGGQQGRWVRKGRAIVIYGA